MEPISFTLDIIDKSFKLANELKARYEMMKGNPKLCAELVDHLCNIKEIVDSVEPDDLPSTLQIFLRDTRKDFNDAMKELECLDREISSSRVSKLPRFMAFFGAKKWSSDLETLKTSYKDLYGRIMNLAGIKGLIEVIREAAKTGSETKDNFKASFQVPPTSAGVTLNLGDPTSHEGKLKTILLGKRAGVAAAVSTSPVAIGMGGVGKTCALKGIGRDREVKQHFSDGVYWLSLGRDVTETQVIEQVAELVKQSGGIMLSDKIRSLPDVSQATREAGGWFSGHRCLFLCDDLWSTESRRQGYFFVLKKLVDEASGSSMLCSTRDRKIATLAEVKHQVQFDVRSTEEAKTIICQCSGFELSEMGSWDESAREAFERVVKVCDGLPLALSIAGQAVTGLARTSRSRSEAWKVYQRRLDSTPAGTRQLIKKSAGLHTGLSSALVASLEVASSRVRAVAGGHGLSAQEMLGALCVLQKQGWAPSSVLARLWGTSDEHEAEEFAEEFVELSIVEREIRTLDNKSLVGFRIHDLVHDFCVMQASEREKDGVSLWHEKLLSGYSSLISGPVKEGESGADGPRWWSDDIADDKYIHSNLSRHLIASGKAAELHKLLLDFRWTVRQLETNGLLALANDFKLLGDNASSMDLSDEGKRDCSWALEIIVRALRLSWPMIDREGLNVNRRDLGFQIHSRLFSLMEKMEWVKCYVESGEASGEAMGKSGTAMPYGSRGATA